jgi:outer membrane protein OmpA-like peptidoglycan-associated protein
MQSRTQVMLTLAILVVPVGGCARNAQRGAVIGAAGGAVAGGVIGAATGGTAKGAIIGAAVGGAAGAIIGDQMDRQAAQLKHIKGAKVERVGEGIQVTFATGLLYDFNSDRVRPDARTNLDELARSLKQYPKTDLLIVGHTDSVGTAEYNQRLSERRSEAAAAYLEGQGVGRERMHARGLGEGEPVSPNSTADGRQRNRRIEVAIYANKAWQAEAKKQASR